MLVIEPLNRDEIRASDYRWQRRKKLWELEQAAKEAKKIEERVRKRELVRSLYRKDFHK